LDEPDAIRKKLGSAVTDSDRKIAWDREQKPGVSNLLEIHAALGRRDFPVEVAAQFEGRGYGDLKQEVAERVIVELTDVRERYAELRPDQAALEKVLAAGAEKARAIAAPTLAEVRDRMGIGSPTYS